MTLSLTPSERKKFRGQAMNMNIAVIIGKAGVTDAVIKTLNLALKKDGLIKIRLIAPDKPTRKTWLEEIVNRTESAICGEVGHTASIYRPKESE